MHLLIGVALCGLAYVMFGGHPSSFEHPVPLPVERSGTGVKKFEFERLLDDRTRFEDLAARGYYTVIEGYTDSCSACRALERELPGLMAARSDVVLRRVRFSERGGKQFKGASEAAIRAEFAAYAAQLQQYRSFNVDASGDEIGIGTCGTPHVEVYGPDGVLLASDSCDDSAVRKTGLGFLRDWIAAERAL